MNATIRDLVSACPQCQAVLPALAAEPLLEPDLATSFPMQHVASDLFTFDRQQYLVLVNRFSGYPFIQKLTRLETSAITYKLFAWFTQYGMADRIRTDGGPQFRSEFDEFCTRNGIVLYTNSPRRTTHRATDSPSPLLKI